MFVGCKSSKKDWKFLFFYFFIFIFYLYCEIYGKLWKMKDKIGEKESEKWRKLNEKNYILDNEKNKKEKKMITIEKEREKKKRTLGKKRKNRGKD
ncbi:hypothetical protein RFI_34686 [Reticulomyxa filosa]|uniref:Uncharacterized protein n=1 Tax=Reticulomyxa filosa TaxID=46433 RepID=X6LNK0_RETFI|nr:hypothetical protein RFI_34686 [Reticulomyxa filosa]|eukprot:ETO02727.1 hypothetical protein RFI_34686 [Reticulomyxa filosa]